MRATKSRAALLVHMVDRLLSWSDILCQTYFVAGLYQPLQIPF